MFLAVVTVSHNCNIYTVYINLITIASFFYSMKTVFLKVE